MTDLRIETSHIETGGTTSGRRAARSSSRTLPPAHARESLAAALNRIAGVPVRSTDDCADDSGTSRLPRAHQYSA